MTASSATAGQPVSPRRPDISPSFSCAPSVSRGSCACCATTPSNAFTYSRARRISTASDTHRPSSENTRTRAAESAIAPSSARRVPPRPSVTAPTGCTSQCPACRPRRQICSTTPAVSATGSVLAIACTAVNPPSAAARVPDATVSASSRPGSRRWVCRSTRPGRATRPAASSTRAPGGAGPSPTLSITPSRITTSAGLPPSGRAPLISQTPWLVLMPLSFVPACAPTAACPPTGSWLRLGPAEQQVQHGHPHADPVGHLLHDGGPGRVRHVGGDLDAAVHRARVHHDGVVGQLGHPGAVQPVAPAVLPHAREVRGVHPLLLDPQHHD